MNSEAAVRSFETLSGLKIRLVSGTYWTGPGQPLSIGLFDTWVLDPGHAFPDIGGGMLGSPMHTYQINISLGLLDYDLKQCAGARVRRQDWAPEEAKLIDNDYYKWERENSMGQSPKRKTARAAREAQ